MPNYAPRISLPYNDVSGVISVWANACARMAVYEHEMDEEVNTTHIHLIMIDCKYSTPEALKRIFRKNIQTTRDGNELWAWSHKKYPNPDISFLKYMSKGHLRPVFTKDITPAEIEEHRALWVEEKRITPDVPQELQKIIKLTKYEVIMKVKNYFDEKAPKDLFGKPQPYEVDDEDLLCCIRRILIDNHQPLGLYKVMDIYDGYQQFFNKTKFITNCLNVLEKRKPRI